jgi:hypothetical protein
MLDAPVGGEDDMPAQRDELCIVVADPSSGVQLTGTVLALSRVNT